MSNKESRIQDIKRIIIPAKEMLNWYPDKPDEVINVVPRDDHWLADNRRNFMEIDKTLEGRLIGIENSLLDSRDSSFKRAHGIEKNISPNEARLLAYTDLLSINDAEQLFRETRISNLKDNYDEEAGIISHKAKSKNLAGRDKVGLYRDKYKTEIDKRGEELSDERKVRELILRKAVLEYFSPKENEKPSVAALPKITEDLKLNLRNASIDKQKKTESRVDNFLDSISEYLQNTRDRELFRRYKYRISPDLVTTDNDTRVLNTTLQFALDPESATTSEKTKSQIQKLGKSYFVFLGNRAAALTPGIEEKYPRISLIYDTYTVAYQSKSTKVINNVGSEVIDNFYHNLSQNRSLDLESKKLVSKFTSDYKNIVSIYNQGLDKESGKPSMTVKNFVTQPETKIFLGMALLNSNEKNLSRNNLYDKSKIFEKVQDTIKTELSKNDVDYLLDFNSSRISYLGREVNFDKESKFLTEHDSPNLYALISQQFLGTILRDEGNEPPTTVSEKWAKVESDYKAFSSEQIPLFLFSANSKINSLYLLNFWYEDRNRIKQVEKQNEELRHGIVNKSLWFVSPRGDRFKNTTDSEIAEKGIKSLTFNIDHRFPREHKVNVIWDGEINPVNYWVDEEGNLLDSQKNPLAMESVYYQLYSNLILRHLYVITSGILSTKEEEMRKGEEIGDKRVEWKRAHYRIYPAGSRYTMESLGAHEHADHIKKDYGIDIYREIRRRQEIGTLLPNQVMTFVRETQPGMEGYDAKPVDVPFDPSWIPQKII